MMKMINSIDDQFFIIDQDDGDGDDGDYYEDCDDHDAFDLERSLIYINTGAFKI